MSAPFAITKAVRRAAPTWVGLAGPSGGGKTLSALRLATGMVRVTGGRVAVLDSEADRALVYAPKEGEAAKPPHTFDFDHIPFGPPFSSERYLEAAMFAVHNGARALVIDSFSHEHESLGGVLEQFEEELYRLAGDDYKKAERMTMLAWKKPKMARRRMINGLLQSPVSIIGCFRTGSKMKIEKGEDPQKLGEIPITDKNFIYEFPLRLLLLNGSDGAPRAPEMPGEKQWVRIPEYFRSFVKPGVQLTEETGQRIAEWAAGGSVHASASAPQPQDAPTDADCDAMIRIIRSTAKASLNALAAQHWPGGKLKRNWSKAQEARIREAYRLRQTGPDEPEDAGDEPTQAIR